MSLPFNNKKDQLKFINACISIHDIGCDCYNPAFHTAKLILQQLAPELKQQEKDQLKQCLGDTTATTTADGDIDIDTGDLEQLFAQEDGEDAETG